MKTRLDRNEYQALRNYLSNILPNSPKEITDDALAESFNSKGFFAKKVTKWHARDARINLGFSKHRRSKKQNGGGVAASTQWGEKHLSIDEIISKIDEYVSLLKQARQAQKTAVKNLQL